MVPCGRLVRRYHRGWPLDLPRSLALSGTRGALTGTKLEGLPKNQAKLDLVGPVPWSQSPSKTAAGTQNAPLVKGWGEGQNYMNSPSSISPSVRLGRPQDRREQGSKKEWEEEARATSLIHLPPEQPSTRLLSVRLPFPPPTTLAWCRAAAWSAGTNRCDERRGLKMILYKT